MIRKELKIAYCEDERIQIEYMNLLMSEWMAKHQILISLSAYESAKAFLFEHPDRYPFDLLILDIDMKEMDGMELARHIRRTDKKLPILFLTNKREHVFEGYEVNAYRYLLKPMEYDKLDEVLKEIEQNCLTQKRYLIEKQEGETIKVDLDDILFIEVNGHYLFLHTIMGELRVKKSLQELMAVFGSTKDAMEQAGFISTHRSYLVNLGYVERVQKTECIMENKEQVPISRNAYKSVNEAFIQYYRQFMIM